MNSALRALALAAALAACSSSVDLASVTGLWVGTEGVVSSAATELELDVVYDGDVRQGCWSADGPAGLLPVRWPAGTVVGLEAKLEIGTTVVATGDTIVARGVTRAAPEPEDELVQLPDGCDVDAGFYDLQTVVGA